MPRSRPKGSSYEREVARAMGGWRTPLSGAAGGNDITYHLTSIWADWGIEAKRRKSLPKQVTGWLAQAAAALGTGTRKKPAVVCREDHGRSLFICYLDDLIPWAEALAEMGQGARVKQLVREARRTLDEIERMA